MYVPPPLTTTTIMSLIAHGRHTHTSTACFLGALQLTAGRLGKSDAVKDAVIHTSVHLGEAEQMSGFGIAVDIRVEGVEDEEVIKAGHEVCLRACAFLGNQDCPW